MTTNNFLLGNIRSILTGLYYQHFKYIKNKFKVFSFS